MTHCSTFARRGTTAIPQIQYKIRTAEWIIVKTFPLKEWKTKANFFRVYRALKYSWLLYQPRYVRYEGKVNSTKSKSNCVRNNSTLSTTRGPSKQFNFLELFCSTSFDVDGQITRPTCLRIWNFHNNLHKIRTQRPVRAIDKIPDERKVWQVRAAAY